MPCIHLTTAVLDECGSVSWPSMTVLSMLYSIYQSVTGSGHLAAHSTCSSSHHRPAGRLNIHVDLALADCILSYPLPRRIYKRIGFVAVFPVDTVCIIGLARDREERTQSQPTLKLELKKRVECVRTLDIRISSRHSAALPCL